VYLPGTTIETPLAAGCAKRLLEPMFFGGGLVLSQVTALTGLEGHTVQNWVKRCYLPPPVNKKYDLRQFCRLLNISVLRECFTLEQSAGILAHVNFILDDPNDDTFGDELLYFAFVDQICGEETGHLSKRTERVLGLMALAWDIADTKQRAMRAYARMEGER